MLKIYDLWLKTMILVVLCFVGYELNKRPNFDYTEKLANIEKVLNDMNTLDLYTKGKKLK